MSSPRSEFFDGVRAELPLLLGVAPFAMIYGATALQVGLSPAISQAMSAVIFAGSSQFIFNQLVAAQAPGIILILTVFVVNLRHALYSASVAPYLKPLHPFWKFILAYLLTDEAYAVTIMRFNQARHARNQHWFALGAGLALWGTWQLGTALGILLGSQIPANWSLDFAIVLTFIAIVVPRLRDRPHVSAALVAGALAVLAIGLPYKLGLLLAATVGIGVGSFVEWRRR